MIHSQLFGTVLLLLLLLLSVARPTRAAGVFVGVNRTSTDRRAVAVWRGPCAAFGLLATRAAFDDGWRRDTVGFALNPLGWLHSNAFGADVWLGYHEAAVNNASDELSYTLSAFGLRAVYRALVEFDDVNADGVYEPAVDTLVAERKLYFPQSKWSCLSTPTVTKVSHDAQSNATVWSTKMCATNVLGGGDFKFCLTFRFADVEAENVDYRVLLTPNSLKQDIEIENFPWKAKNSSLAVRVVTAGRTRQTLITAAKPSNGEEMEVPNKLNRVSFSGQGDVSAGFFSWSSKAFHERDAGASGKTFAVKASTLARFDNDTGIDLAAGWSASVVHLTVADGEHPSYILLDPTVGVEVSNGMPPKTRVIVGVVVGVAVLMGCVCITTYFLKRRRQSYSEV